MDVPRHQGRNVPHWSRWEQGATSFGPTGRVLTTVLIVGWVLLLPVPFAIVAGLGVPFLLKDIWKKDWIVPGEPKRPPLPVEPRPEPALDRTPVQHVARWVGWGSLAALGVVYLAGGREARILVLMSAIVLAFVWFLRGFLSR